MKTSVIITTLLITQVSASFFDVFHGAVLSVQNSFGKLLSDVVTDVKDTVDCTILAVEHVLSLSEDATIRYYDKCGQGTNQTDLQNNAKQNESLPKVEVSIKFPDSEEYLQKVIPAEIDARINQTLSKVLGDHNPNNNLLSIENVLAKESEQLADVSDLVKNELKKLSNEVNTDLEHIKQKDAGPSVDTILNEIKVLEKREQNTRNTSEAIKIHQVIDEVLDKLDAIEVTEANENVKLEEILKDLENNSNNSFSGLRQQFEEWKEEESRHLSKIRDKIEEHEKKLNHSKKIDSNRTHTILMNTDKIKDTAALFNKNTDSNDTDAVIQIAPENITYQRTEEFKDSTTGSFIRVTEMVTTKANDNALSHNLATSTPALINIPDEKIQATVTTTASVIENSSTFILNEAMISNISGNLSSIETTTISKLTTLANSSASETEEPSDLMTYSSLSLGTTLLNDSYENPMTSTPSTTTESTLASEMPSPVTVNEKQSTTTYAPIAFPAIVLDNDSNTNRKANTPSKTIETELPSEISPAKSTTRTVDEEPSHKAIPALKLDSDSNVNGITSTPKGTGRTLITNEETTTLTREIVSMMKEPVENKTSTEELLVVTTYATFASTDSNDNIVTTTTSPISESSLTINPSVKKTVTLTDSNYNNNAVSSSSRTSVPAEENTNSKALNQPVESTTSPENDQSSVSTLSENNNNLDHPATSSTFTTKRRKGVNKNIETFETTTVSENQETNNITTTVDSVASSTDFIPLKENVSSTGITLTESTIAARIEKVSTDLLIRDEINSTPKMTINHNFIINSPPLMITEVPSIINKVPLIEQSLIPRMNRPFLPPRSVEKVTPIKISQQGHNIHGAPNNDLPKSLTKGLLNSRWPLNNPDQVYNTPQRIGKTAVPARSFAQQLHNPILPTYHGSDKDSIPNRFSDIRASPFPTNPKPRTDFRAPKTPELIPTVPNQQPQNEMTAHDREMFDMLDSMTAQFMDSRSPFASLDKIMKLDEIPTAPGIKNTPPPRIPTDRGRMNTFGRPLRSAYTTYRPPSLTTYRPPNKARADDYQISPLDYDSFFHVPQKNSEAHQRALKDAQQLIANSKLSNRIIDKVLQSKNNFGARSIFNNPRTLNQGK